jgi:hypothetical protein
MAAIESTIATEYAMPPIMPSFSAYPRSMKKWRMWCAPFHSGSARIPNRTPEPIGFEASASARS